MTQGEEKFQQAIDRFDAANAQDPRREAGQPVELIYAQRMTQWLDRLYPDASEPLKLAARSQHIQRWMIPRDRFPMTRSGYHRWRTSLYGFHADTAAEILRQVGYDEPAISRVRSLLRKEKLKSDPHMQALEDVACLVFLEDELDKFAARHDEAKVINILRKTWGKMSPVGQKAASELKLSPPARQLIEKALAGPAPADPQAS